MINPQKQKNIIINFFLIFFLFFFTPNKVLSESYNNPDNSINPNHSLQHVLKLINGWNLKKLASNAKIARNIALYQVNDRIHKYLPAVSYTTIEQHIIKSIQQTKAFKVKECLICKNHYVSLHKNKFHVRRQMINYKNMGNLAKKLDLDAFLFWGVYIDQNYFLINFKLVAANSNEILYTETIRSDNFQKITQKYNLGFFLGISKTSITKKIINYEDEQKYYADRTTLFGFDIIIEDEYPVWDTRISGSYISISNGYYVYGEAFNLILYRGYHFSKKLALYSGAGITLLQLSNGIIYSLNTFLEYKLTNNWKISIGYNYGPETKILYSDEPQNENNQIINPVGMQLLLHYEFN